MAKRRKNRNRTFAILVFLIILSVYGGLKGGEYMAKRLAKPIHGSKSYFDSIKSWGKTESSGRLTEDDMVALTAVITGFINAEHLKDTDRLSVLVDKDYYNYLIKDIGQLTLGQPLVKDISYKNMEENEVELEIIFKKDSKEIRELLTVKRQNETWKIVKVDR